MISNTIFLQSFKYAAFSAIVFFSFWPTDSYSQEKVPAVDVILQKAQAYYSSNPEYVLELSYGLFRNIKKPVYLDSYKGIMKVKNGRSYIKINNTDFLNNGREILKVNHDQRAMVYDDSKETAEVYQNPVDILKFLSLFETSRVYSEEGVWRCELTTPKYTQLSYGKVILYIAKNTFQLKRQVMMLTAPASFKDEKGKFTNDLKYLEIIVEEINDDGVTAFPSMEMYIIRKENRVYPVKKYSSYKIIDNSKN